MLNFVFILLIIFEIILTYILVKYIIKLEKKVENYHRTLMLYSVLILEINEKVKSTLKSLNKVVSILTSKKIALLKTVIHYLILAFQVFYLIRSLKSGKNLFKIKTMKKLLYPYFIKNLIKYLILS